MEKTPTPTTVAERYGLNPCQSAFWNLAAQDQHKFLLAYGGGGSGKSYLILLMFMLTAMAVPKTRFGIFRLTRASCQETLFDKTLGEVFDTAFPGMAQDEEKVKISQSTMEVEFANGSLIMFDGLDENRLKKIDGNAYNYVWLNECNEFSYAHVSRLIGRLAAQAVVLEVQIDRAFDHRRRWAGTALARVEKEGDLGQRLAINGRHSTGVTVAVELTVAIDGVDALLVEAVIVDEQLSLAPFQWSSPAAKMLVTVRVVKSCVPVAAS